MTKPLGKIEFELLREGRLYVSQQFDHASITRARREEMAELLEEIASHMRQDQFENDGEYKFFKAPVEREKR